ncbi:ankyrin repeat-containing domain protein [Apiospora sp. TS-2023a]
MGVFRLFELPAELRQLTFYFFFISRDFKRAMRLRLVNRQFKACLDDMIFTRSMFHRLVADGVINDDELTFSLEKAPLAPALAPAAGVSVGNDDERPQREWIGYIYPYLIAHALREQSTQSTLGRLRRAAQAVAEMDGGGGGGSNSNSNSKSNVYVENSDDAVRSCIDALLPLAAAQVPGLLLARELATTDEGLRADVHRAAVWLGKTAYVAQLVAEEDVRFCQLMDDDDVDSEGGSILAHPVQAAAIQGNVEMLQIVLGALRPPRGTSERDREENLEYTWVKIFVEAMQHRRREVLEWALDMGPELPCIDQLEGQLSSIPWPDLYERATALVERYHNGEGDGDGRYKVLPMDVGNALMMHTMGQRIEMFRYWLNRTVRRLGDQADQRQRRTLYWTLNRAVRERHEPIIRMLLEDVGVDPNWTDPSCTSRQAPAPLLAAVRMGRLPVVRLLLDHGAHPDGGDPAPITAAVAQERLDLYNFLRERGAKSP